MQAASTIPTELLQEEQWVENSDLQLITILGTEKNKTKRKIWKRKNVMPGWATKGFIFTAYPISLHVAFHWAQPLLAATR